jgi:hypothetical protein
MFGFTLMAKKKSIEFYTPSKEERDEWIEHLKSIVILLDLKDELEIIKIFGKGNFANVHLCKRKSEPNKSLALKTVQKDSIKKSRRTIVSTSITDHFLTHHFSEELHDSRD